MSLTRRTNFDLGPFSYAQTLQLLMILSPFSALSCAEPSASAPSSNRESAPLNFLRLEPLSDAWAVTPRQVCRRRSYLTKLRYDASASMSLGDSLPAMRGIGGLAAT